MRHRSELNLPKPPKHYFWWVRAVDFNEYKVTLGLVPRWYHSGPTFATCRTVWYWEPEKLRDLATDLLSEHLTHQEVRKLEGEYR